MAIDLVRGRGAGRTCAGEDVGDRPSGVGCEQGGAEEPGVGSAVAQRPDHAVIGETRIKRDEIRKTDATSAHRDDRPGLGIRFGKAQRHARNAQAGDETRRRKGVEQSHGSGV